MKMKIYTYIYIYICTDDFHIMLYKVAFFPYTNTTVCRVQTCVEIYLFIVWFGCFHIFEVVQRSTKLYNNELIVHDIVNIYIYIYIGREVQR